ncbi:MAG: ABC transporter substrate-binding protein [Betaproteobacteria bacterium]|nr:ABC transporter substrate-binding protein [Betaproteobacteria bacterium]
MRICCGIAICIGVTLDTAAQQAPKVPRIGWLSLTGAPVTGVRQESFRQGLRDLGYIDGQNIIIEHRSAEGKLERLPELAAELIQLKVDVLVALEPPVARAVQRATRTIPIVMRSTSDPVEEGLVASLARPGGNITGVASYSMPLLGKRLELLLEVVPRVSRVAVLWNPSSRNSPPAFKELQAAARTLGVQLQSLEVRSVDDFEGALGAAVMRRADALITIRSPLLVINRGRIAELAANSKLPAIYDDREFVEAGGLMSYGTNLADSYRRAAAYVDKLLKGANPAELPVEQPTRFELFVNLKTARQIGLAFPPEILIRADKVIK